MAVIDLSNYATTLVQSTDSRAGTPDGNIYFDKTNGLIEFISASELATLDLTSVGGGATDPNPLILTDGIKFEAIYVFENQERAADETLREYNRWTSGTFKFGGAYNYINDRQPSTAADVSIVRGSGWNEIDTSGVTQKIYFGNKGLSNIEAASQPYYMLSDSATPVLNDITPVNFGKVGQIDEAVLVYENGVSDTRLYENTTIRTFGNNYDRKETTTDLGIAELGGYSTGFALNESGHLTTGDYTLADVYGGAIIAPWDTMTLEKLAVAQTETGFNEADGDFTWVLHNPGTGTNGSPVSQGDLYQCVACLDALSQTDDDIDSGTETVTHGKRVATWYYYNATGQIVTNSGADALGLFIENIPTADEQDVYFTDDAGDIKTRPFVVGINANIGAIAKADALAWYHSFFAALYNQAGTVTVLDSSGAAIKGMASTANGDNIIIDAFDYDGDTVGGTAGTDKNCVYVCEGDGGAVQAKTLYTITRQTTVAFTCAPGVENNA